MTDVHSHILYNVDDGSYSIEESLELLKDLKNIGFKNVILTPHYIEGSDYQCQNQEKLDKLDILRMALKENNIDISIYLGNEIFINNNIIDNLNEGNIYSLNNSKYLLIELPFHNQILNLEDIIYEIKYQGYIPIIAHPERYTYFQDNPKLVDKLKEEDILFQSNFGSILGYHGKSAEKLLKYLLKKQYIDYLGTDIHHTERKFVINNFNKIEKKFIKLSGKDYYQKILSNNDSLINE